jgi:hypothetical protein
MAAQEAKIQVFLIATRDLDSSRRDGDGTDTQELLLDEMVDMAALAYIELRK